jgi:hypothetical protein
VGRAINRTAIVVRPGQRFLDWLHWADPTSADLSLSDLQKDTTVYLIREGDTDDEVRENLSKVCGRIFEEQLDGWYRVPSSWPEQRDLETFERWFEWESHSIVEDLCSAPIRRERF